MCHNMLALSEKQKVKQFEISNNIQNNYDIFVYIDKITI